MRAIVVTVVLFLSFWMGDASAQYPCRYCYGGYCQTGPTGRTYCSSTCGPRGCVCSYWGNTCLFMQGVANQPEPARHESHDVAAPQGLNLHAGGGSSACESQPATFKIDSLVLAARGDKLKDLFAWRAVLAHAIKEVERITIENTIADPATTFEGQFSFAVTLNAIGDAMFPGGKRPAPGSRNGAIPLDTYFGFSFVPARVDASKLEAEVQVTGPDGQILGAAWLTYVRDKSGAYVLDAWSDSEGSAKVKNQR